MSCRFRIPAGVGVVVLLIYCAYSVPGAERALAGRVEGRRYHAAGSVFSCPIPLEGTAIQDRSEPGHALVFLSEEMEQYMVHCILSPEKSYYPKPEVVLSDEPALRRQMLSMRPEWEEKDIRVLHSEVALQDGSSVVFAVVLVPNPEAGITEGSPRKIQLDQVFGFAVFRCFHIFEVTLHSIVHDVGMARALGTFPGLEGLVDRGELDQAVREVRERLLQFVAGFETAVPSSYGHLRGAAQAGDVWAVKRMLAAGADVNAADRKGTTALMAASWAGEAAVAGVLLSAGARVDAAEHGAEYIDWTALMYAAEWGQTDVVRILLEAGADPARAGHMSAGDELACTPLALAAWKGYPETVRTLLKAGAKADRWALSLPVVSGHAPVVQAMLEAGVGVDARGPGAATLLILASTEGQAGIVRLLLAAGANVDLEDAAGLTAVQHAERRGHAEIVRLLKSSR